MKLSDAIMLNGMTKPQGFGGESVMSIEAPCAIGGALQSIGKQVTDQSLPNYWAAKDAWPWAWTSGSYQCPICLRTDFALAMIWHLNDCHCLTRQQIAEWVATVEPADNPKPVSCEATLVQNSEDQWGQLCGKQCAPGHSLCPDHLSEVEAAK